MSLHEAQESDRQATAALDAASEALDDHTSTVGERCLLEDRRPTSEEIDRFDELCEAWDAAAQAATDAATNLKAAEQTDALARIDRSIEAKKYARMLEGRGY